MKRDGISTYEDVAPQLALNGYAPLPLWWRKKNPRPADWSAFVFSPTQTRSFLDAGTGILCGDVVACDIDIRDAELAVSIEKLAEKLFGPAPRRVGEAPKVLRVYRTEAAFGKHATHDYRLPTDAPGEKAHRVEILAKGQQFVAYNIHPNTGQPYSWNGIGEPLTVPVTSLSSITEAQVSEFIGRCDALLASRGQRLGRLSQSRESHLRYASTEELQARNPEECREALAALPNADLAYDDWISVLHAIKGAFGDAGLADALSWSAKSHSKNVPAETTRCFRAAKPAQIGAGSIYFWAREAGWAPRGAQLDQSAGTPLERARISIRGDLEAGPEAIDAAQPPRFICNPLLPVAGASIAAPGGTGKTTVVLNEKVRVAAGCALYGRIVERHGPCVLVTAEDGAQHGRYLLQQILLDGTDQGRLSREAAQCAKAAVKVVGWHRSIYGPVVDVDKEGNMHRAPIYDLLLELLAPLKPVYVTLDPAILFGAGERHGNDGEAFLAAMLHDSAMALGACVQLVDHVAKAVHREGVIDQYAARGGSAKTDNARLARQLVAVTRDNAAGPVPSQVTAKDMAAFRVLQLHTTKSNYAPKGEPLWLKRHRYWIEYLPPPSEEEVAHRVEAAESARIGGDLAAIVEYVRQTPLRFSQRELEESRILRTDGQKISRGRIRDAVQHGILQGALVLVDFPPEERRGARKQYVALPGAIAAQ